MPRLSDFSLPETLKHLVQLLWCHSRPRVRTLNQIFPSDASARRVIVPPAGVNLMAFPIRFEKT